MTRKRKRHTPDQIVKELRDADAMLNAKKDCLQHEQDWCLDPLGNWKGFKEDADGDATWDLEQTRTANKVNEITDVSETTGPSWATPAYDAAGNMTSIPKPTAPSSAYAATYDAWNRLVKLVDGSNTVAEYEYDPRNYRMVAKNYASGLLDETRHYYYSNKWQVLEERVDTSSDADRLYLWGLRYIDDCVFRERDTDADGSLDERLYALQDDNWNVTALTDESGSVQERHAYTAYGTPSFFDASWTSRSSSSYEWETLYAGYRWDAFSALYQVRHRYLHSVVGFFVTQDHLKFEDSLNLNEYTQSQPLSLFDPFGLEPPLSTSGETLEVVIQNYIPMKYVHAPHGIFAGDGLERGDGYPNWDKTPGIENNDYRTRLRGIFDTGTGDHSYRSDAGETIKFKKDPSTGKLVPDKKGEAKEGDDMRHQAVYEGRPTANGLGEYRCHVVGYGMNPISYIPGTEIQVGPAIDYDMYIYFTPVDKQRKKWKINVIGKHNRFPAYEVFARVNRSDWQRVYGYDPRSTNTGPETGLITTLPVRAPESIHNCRPVKNQIFPGNFVPHAPRNSAPPSR